MLTVVVCASEFTKNMNFKVSYLLTASAVVKDLELATYEDSKTYLLKWKASEYYPMPIDTYSEMARLVCDGVVNIFHFIRMFFCLKVGKCTLSRLYK